MALPGYITLAEAECDLSQGDGRCFEGRDSEALVEIGDGRVFSLAETGGGRRGYARGSPEIGGGKR